jgi:murein L,D-transpeptidase YafK
MKKVLFLISSFLCVAIILVLLNSYFNPLSKPLPQNVQADKITVEKMHHRMTLYKNGDVLRIYKIALGRGGMEPKQREGDKKTPEGIYFIKGRNAQSAYHLSLRISYPDEKDIEDAESRNESPGGDIMIHGIRNGLGWLKNLHSSLNWTSGCIAVTNEEMDEIWRVVPDGTPIEIRH